MSEDWNVRPRGVVPLPSPEEAAREQRGVVFYRIEAVRFPMAETLSVIVGIARLVTSMGPGRNASKPYEMRVGFKHEDGNAHYWVGFNHEAFGAMFEQALRAADVRWTRRDRQRLGEKASNKVLSIADPDVLERKRQELLGNGRGRRPVAGPAAPRRAEPVAAEPVVRMGPFDRMKAARQELAGTGIGQRFRRGRRGRRGTEETDEQQ